MGREDAIFGRGEVLGLDDKLLLSGLGGISLPAGAFRAPDPPAPTAPVE